MSLITGTLTVNVQEVTGSLVVDNTTVQGTVTISVVNADTVGLLATNNLSDLQDAATARTNLGVDSSAEVDAKILAGGGGGVSDHSALNLDDGTNPHGTTKTDVGLSNVDNTSDLAKPISTATQTALDAKANVSHGHVKADISDFNEGDYATAAQGALADTAVQPTDIDTLAELNATLTDATLIDTTDARLSDARTPTAHTHPASEINDFDAEVSNNPDVTANTAKTGITAQQSADITANNAKVSADGSVTTHNDVTDAGSGQIITSAERTKLTGIETGATADQTGAEIVSAIDTQLGNTDWQSGGGGGGDGWDSIVLDSDFSVVNTNAYSTIPGFSITVPLGSVLSFYGTFVHRSPTAEDLRIRYDTSPFSLGNNGITFDLDQVNATAFQGQYTVTLTGTNSDKLANYSGFCHADSEDVTISFLITQNTAGANPSIVRVGSYIRYKLTTVV